MIDFTPFTTDTQIHGVITKNLDQLKQVRKPWEPLWDREIKIFQPRRFDLLRTAQKGQQYGARVFDGHPQNAANKFVMGLLAYQMNRSVPWIQFVPSDQKKLKLDEVKDYSQNAAEQVLWSFNNRSNFYGSTVWLAKDSTVIGSGVAIPREDLDNGRMIYDTIHPGESYFAEDKNDDLGAYLRPTKLTAIKMLEMFDEKNLSKRIIKDAKAERGGNPFAEYDVLFAMYKNVKSKGADAIKPEDREWKIFWLLISSTASQNRVLQKTGTNFGPLSWRQGKEPGQAYGTSLAADALTEALQVNKYGELLLRSYHNLVDPALLAHKNLRGKIRRKPRGTTYSNDPNKETVRLLYEGTGAKTTAADRELDRIHASIDDKFFVRFFETLLSGDLPAMTAFEVSQRMGEKAVLLSAISMDFETQYLENAVATQFEFERKAGRLPPVPDVLFDQNGNAEIDVNFIGPLPQLQKSILQSRGTINALALIQQISAIWPDSVIKVNEFQLIEDAAVAQGMKQDLFKSDEELNEILGNIAQREEEDRQIAAGTEIAKALPSAGKAVEENSPLAALAGA